MPVRYQLEDPRHYRPSQLNLTTDGDHHRFRAVLNINVYRWLVQHHFPYSITIEHFETANPDLQPWTTPWFHEWERTIRCYIEFDDPGHLILFKLTWG